MGTLPVTFSDYYQNIPADRRERLGAVEKLIRRTFPDAEASMRYRMPTFETASGWIAFASQKNHVSVYTCSAEKLAPYLSAHPKANCGKGCLRFTDATEIDFDVLRQVVRNALSR